LTVAKQVPNLGVAHLGLRSMWAELDIKDIEEQVPSLSEGNDAVRSVYDLRQILDLESHLIRILVP